MTAKTIEKKVNTTWKDICHKRNIPRYVEQSYTSSNTDLPPFYHLIKTHKLQQEIKIRSIVSNSNGPTMRLSWLLSNLLKPLIKEVPAHLENSFELINDIKTRSQLSNQHFPYPFSPDVVALYTSIPITESMENIIDKLTHLFIH